MPVTQADLDNINAAIASGERQVTIGSQSITYRSIDDLIKAQQQIAILLQQQTDAANGTVTKRRGLLYYGGRGYHSRGWDF